MLFDEVRIEHINKAINDFNKNGNPIGFTSSKYYDVRINNTLYPPKPIMAIANFYATGRKIENYFYGGADTPCFKTYERLGIEIVIKSNGLKNELTPKRDLVELNFYKLILDFLEQATTGNLKTKHFPKSYNNLKIKVSFGAGNQARIPWIAIIKEPNKVTDGIYPVYLYFKNIEKLILAFGLSETNNPKVKWEINNPTSISNYFHKNDLGKPERYGNSYIYKVYDVNNFPNESTMNIDLENLVTIYKNQYNTKVSKQEMKNPSKQIVFDLSNFMNSNNIAGLNYTSQLITRYVSSLATKPFVLLSGLSGSGKTKLAQAFALWIAQDESQYCIVPVGADWTNREPLLGYVNALSEKEYILPENGALRLLIEANKKENINKPYFLILDEMNLSHVERYFADFLSVMESKDQLKLHGSKEEKSEVPAYLFWPSNLFIVGTVNIDETTYMFSPKVLDRANVIEFRVNKNDIKEFLDSPSELDLTKIVAKGASMGESFISIASKKNFPKNDTTKLNEKLVLFFEELKKTGAEFGYRTASEIHRLYNQLTALDETMKEDDKIDIAIMQKLLPKLHGSRRKLCPILEVLAMFCVKSNTDVIKDFLNNKEALIYNGNDNVLYPLSLEKITRMYKGAIDNGFASYAEA